MAGEAEKRIPRMGYGTWARLDSEGVEAMLAALEVGYRHLDTAQSYGTEPMVGEALRRCGLPRQDVFVTTKIDTANFGPGKLLPSLRHSLDQLGVDTVDLTLIHWPSPNGELALPVYLDQLVEAQDAGLTRLIGVSNFTTALLDEAERRLGPGRIATNQIELNPLFKNKKVAVQCQRRDILVTCYLPIAHGRLAGNPVLQSIGARYGATVEQVAIAWELAKGYAAIPTSSRRERIASNFAATKLSLSPDDIAAIDALADGPRSIAPSWGPEWDA
ncbi:aldo/keto reductase [Pleomorphomonas oryzae]|uniref:aldo/keto reductase n=1 Tax=Pleomorphomonas oryzae TaxID=261934 RepID=UPI00040F3F13|nr:aldo/keto reductase [Pleomorphomonas oryzae]